MPGKAKGKGTRVAKSAKGTRGRGAGSRRGPGNKKTKKTGQFANKYQTKKSRKHVGRRRKKKSTKPKFVPSHAIPLKPIAAQKLTVGQIRKMANRKMTPQNMLTLFSMGAAYLPTAGDPSAGYLEDYATPVLGNYKTHFNFSEDLTERPLSPKTSEYYKKQMRLQKKKDKEFEQELDRGRRRKSRKSRKKKLKQKNTLINNTV